MADRKVVRIDDDKFAKNPVGQGAILGRDTIYVDTDDDITSIIEKVKSSKHAVVALVPPARAGTLQSVVNLRLLQNATKKSRKQLSLVTSDKALVSLASGLKIPVAKNLAAQADIPVSRNDLLKNNSDDEIDGKDLGVGELADLGSDDHTPMANESKDDAAVNAIETDDEIRGDEDDGRPNSDEPKQVSRQRNPKPSPAKNKKIPNFSKFRKWFLIGGGALVLLIIFIIWATVFAPHGTITITATTTAVPVSASLSLTPNSATDINNLRVQPIAKTTSKTGTANIAATGTQLVGGARATGTVTITNDSSSSSFTLPQGTSLVSSSGMQYVLNSDTLVPGAQVSQGVLSAGVASNVGVTAYSLGSKYNTNAPTHLSISRYNSLVAADSNGAISGGQDQTRQIVVQQSDLDTAVEKIKAQDNQNQFKQQLRSQFGSDATVIDSSFGASYGTPTASPAVGSVVSGDTTPTASLNISYAMFAISHADLNAFLNSQLQASLNGSGQSGQKIYDNGLAKATLNNFQLARRGNYTVSVAATGQIGPNIDANRIKDMASNQKAGQIRSSLQSQFSNISKVDVNFTPFWVSSISDKSKLTVNFAVSGKK